MPFAIGGNQLDTGYEVSNSLRYNDDDSPRLNRTQTGGNRRTFTISCWIKRASLGKNTAVFSAKHSDFLFRFGTSDDVQFRDLQNSNFNLSTNNVFRDVSAWYHFVFAVDTTQSTSSNRIKFYVNGTQQTSNFGTETYPSQNYDTELNNNGEIMYVGARADPGDSVVTSQIFDGYIAEFHSVDGSQLDPTSFGEFNDNGVWIPKQYTGSYGTNGFFMQFKQTGTSANSSGIGADTSGNDNHFTPNNLAAIDVTTDTCTNNFATLNNLNIRLGIGITFAEANTQVEAGSSTGTAGAFPTIAGLKRGKWYAEFKPTVVNGSGIMRIGIEDTDFPAGDGLCNIAASAYVSNGNKGRNATDTSFGNSYTNNDIIGVALDLDNGAIYFSKNGTFQNSGDPTSGSSKTGAAFTDILTILPSGGYMFAFNFNFSGGTQDKIQANFGNPPFSISSGNSDGDGHGNFEFAVPTGYFALCTKNLAEYG